MYVCGKLHCNWSSHCINFIVWLEWIYRKLGSPSTRFWNLIKQLSFSPMILKKKKRNFPEWLKIIEYSEKKGVFLFPFSLYTYWQERGGEGVLSVYPFSIYFKHMSIKRKKKTKQFLLRNFSSESWRNSLPLFFWMFNYFKSFWKIFFFKIISIKENYLI